MFKSVLKFSLIALSAAGLPNLSSAQTMEDSHAATFEIAYSKRDANDSMESMANSTRDSSLNKVVTASPGWGFSATAIGNLVNVVTQGSNNTIMINASQINKGSQQATIAFPGDKKSSDKETPVSPSTAAVVSSPTYATFK